MSFSWIKFLIYSNYYRGAFDDNIMKYFHISRILGSSHAIPWQVSLDLDVQLVDASSASRRSFLRTALQLFQERPSGRCSSRIQSVAIAEGLILLLYWCLVVILKCNNRGSVHTLSGDSPRYEGYGKSHHLYFWITQPHPENHNFKLCYRNSVRFQSG